MDPPSPNWTLQSLGTAAKSTKQQTRRTGGYSLTETPPNLSPARNQVQPSNASPIKEWAWTHEIPTSTDRARNRRNLIQWNRPRMAEKLLLCIQYECALRGVTLPWDAIAHRLQPGSTESAIMQHLSRLRPTLLAEGHLIPPAPSRPGSVSAEEVVYRGFIRDDENGDQEDSRGVRYRKARFTEAIEHRKTNLGAPCIHASEALPIKAFLDNDGCYEDEEKDEEPPKSRRIERGGIDPFSTPQKRFKESPSPNNSPRRVQMRTPTPKSQDILASYYSTSNFLDHGFQDGGPVPWQKTKLHDFPPSDSFSQQFSRGTPSADSCDAESGQPPNALTPSIMEPAINTSLWSDQVSPSMNSMSLLPHSLCHESPITFSTNPQDEPGGDQETQVWDQGIFDARDYFMMNENIEHYKILEGQKNEASLH